MRFKEVKIASLEGILTGIGNAIFKTAKLIVSIILIKLLLIILF